MMMPLMSLNGRISERLFGVVPLKVKWLIVLVSFAHVATGYFWVTTSAFLRERGVSESSVGLILAVNGVTFILAAIPLGILADRLGRRSVLGAGLLGLPPALLIYVQTAEPVLLVAASAIGGVSKGAFLTTRNALIADMSMRGRAEVGVRPLLHRVLGDHGHRLCPAVHHPFHHLGGRVVRGPGTWGLLRCSGTDGPDKFCVPVPVATGP